MGVDGGRFIRHFPGMEILLAFLNSPVLVAIVWATAALILFGVFKKPITNFIDRVKGAKWRGIDLALREELGAPRANDPRPSPRQTAAILATNLTAAGATILTVEQEELLSFVDEFLDEAEKTARVGGVVLPKEMMDSARTSVHKARQSLSWDDRRAASDTIFKVRREFIRSLN